MRTVLTEDFFSRPAPEVAPDLLGKYLVRRRDGKELASMITETEAYEGAEDLACHAAKGRTNRTEVMFGRAGRLYVYLIYGMYDMLNVVTHTEDRPSAVLIRGLESVSGPGRLTRAFGITREFNTKIAAPATGLWFEDRGIKVPEKCIACTARIGVAYAGPVWAAKEWRFFLRK